MTDLKPQIKQSHDRHARANGLYWEARFNHPTLGTVVMPFATRKEAEQARLKK